MRTLSPFILGRLFGVRISKAVQAGIVNSSANTIASGSMVRLSAQANCEA